MGNGEWSPDDYRDENGALKKAGFHPYTGGNFVILKKF